MRIFGLLFVALISTVSVTAKADGNDTSHVWVGGHYGVSVPSADGTTARAMTGITAGAKIGTEFGLGGYYFAAHKGESIGEFDYDLYGIEGTYHFEGEASGAFFGARVGISKVNAPTALLSTSPVNVGIVGGYDYTIIDHVSVGAEVNMFSIQPSSGTPSFTLVDFLASLKFWL